jgi:hypothetical protein
VFLLSSARKGFEIRGDNNEFLWCFVRTILGLTESWYISFVLADYFEVYNFEILYSMSVKKLEESSLCVAIMTDLIIFISVRPDFLDFFFCRTSNFIHFLITNMRQVYTRRTSASDFFFGNSGWC